MLIKHWMAKDVVSVSPKTSLLKCKALLNDMELKRLPVVDSENRVVGILSQNDISQFMPAHATGYEILESLDTLSEKTASDCMTVAPFTVKIDETLEDAAELMIEKKISCLPVVDKEEKLVGIVTEWDIFKSLISITGVNQPGIQVSFEVENKPGTLRALLDVVKRFDMRVIAVLSKIRTDNRRLISIRCKGPSIEQEDAMIAELSKNGSMRYWVRDKKTHMLAN